VHSDVELIRGTKSHNAYIKKPRMVDPGQSLKSVRIDRVRVLLGESLVIYKGAVQRIVLVHFCPHGGSMSEGTKTPSPTEVGRATVNRAITGATAGAVVGGLAGMPGAVVGAVIGGFANVLADKVLHSSRNG
jgi:hypothetical protein